MKITIESTSKIVLLNGILARVWEGQTESGVLIHCYVNRVAVSTDNAPSVFAEFERELQEAPTLPGIEALPLRLIL
jgi:hypothetical protein